MTLTELMAAMAVAFILMAFIGQIYIFTGNIFEKTAAADDLARMTRAVIDCLEDRIVCADQVALSSEEDPETEYGHEILFSSDGRIYCDKEPVFREEFYRDRRVFCRILSGPEEEKIPVIKYRITWMNSKNTALYSAESVIKLVNLELAGNWVTGSGQESSSGAQGKELYFYYTETEH